MVNVPNLLNLVTYVRGTLHMGVSDSATTITNFVGATSGFALIGAFLSDSYITRSKTILLFGPLEFLVIFLFFFLKWNFFLFVVSTFYSSQDVLHLLVPLLNMIKHSDGSCSYKTRLGFLWSASVLNICYQKYFKYCMDYFILLMICILALISCDFINLKPLEQSLFFSNKIPETDIQRNLPCSKTRCSQDYPLIEQGTSIIICHPWRSFVELLKWKLQCMVHNSNGELYEPANASCQMWQTHRTAASS